MEKARPFVSVIIPTYHDWERLKLCLAALREQTYPQDRFEVLVVNNDPRDPVPEMGLPNKFQTLSESKPGSYAARNKGLSVAKGEILAFTDSDCIPYEDWLEKAVERLLGGAERIAGHVELFFKSEKLTPAEIFEKAFAFPQARKASKGESVTANMVTWRRIFDEVGLFNELLMSGGDNEWSIRAQDLGFSIAFAPNVIVRHPARSTIKELKSKWARVVCGSKKISKPIWRDSTYWVLRSFMPPVFAFRDLFKRKDLSTYEKIVALSVLYFKKIYSTVYVLIVRSSRK